MRKFEKISLNEFIKDKCGTIEDYENYSLPQRKTKYSAGYDFELIRDLTLKKHEIKKIPLGIKCLPNSDEFLMIVVRSSLGFKYNIRLTNQVGIIDYDYYNNEDNEGHIWVSIQNEGEKDITFHKGEAICQGIFVKYGIITNEKTIKEDRKGGIGSTNK